MFTPLIANRMATIFILQILLILGAVQVVPATQNQAPQGDRVAVVNGEDIPVAEFKTALQQALHQQKRASEKVTAAQIRALRKEVVANLIGRRLAYQESQRLGITVDPVQIDSEMEKVAARFSRAVALEEALDKADLARDRLRLQFKKDIAIRQLLEEQVIRNIKVGDRELRNFYDNNPNLFKTPALVKASHIFIEAGAGVTREERKKAVTVLRSIRDRLEQGADFSEMAIDYSQCPSSENGGDLGYFEKERMIKGFAEAAFALNPGEISTIVRTSRGYHLIKVDDRKPKMKASFEDVKIQLLRNLRIEESTQAIKAYLNTLRESAEVDIFIRL